MKKIKILHLISTLDTGGAEQNLLRLVCAMDNARFKNIIVSMTDIGPVGEKIQGCNCNVHALNMKKGLPDPRGIYRLYGLVRQYDPDIIQSWMYHANLLGLAFGFRRPNIWNIRCSNMDLEKYGPVYRWTVKAGALLSRLPERVVVNSYAGKDWHANIGYRPKKWEIIPNGFDTKIFRPDPEARKQVRDGLAIPQNAFVIGLIARLDPMKGHKTFFDAANRCLKAYPDTHFILAGRGIRASNPVMDQYLRKTICPERFHLLGETNAIPAIDSALDCATSSSYYGEGLPNAIGEAMATGVPCIVTDAGDSRRMVKETGFVVPPFDPEGLNRAWQHLITAGEQECQRLGMLARRRIIDLYDIQAMLRDYTHLYQGISDNDCRSHP
ncbi:MAG: glycosyltransferase [Thermodesulfobacteriota bacterium]|nr:glycosyltransferase [Thermodesulfobacteriota bacterium]